MTKQPRKPERPAKAGAIELSEDRLDMTAAGNNVTHFHRFYGDADGDFTPPRPPQLKAG